MVQKRNRRIPACNINTAQGGGEFLFPAGISYRNVISVILLGRGGRRWTSRICAANEVFLVPWVGMCLGPPGLQRKI